MMPVMKENKGKYTLSRRSFLKSTWKYLGIVALLEAVVVSFSMMKTRSSGTTLDQKNLKVIGSLSEIPPGTLIPFRSGHFFLLRLDNGGLMAISMTCSHLGCTVNWDATENIFKCPCHSSSFDRMGNVIKSPAAKALNYHRVIVENGTIMVDLDNLMVRQKFDPSVVTYV
jgi:cytochrome b6-f complex iron-sulfur subunit